MKIVEIIPQLASGGAERLVVDLSNELVKEHDVFLITFYSDELLNFYNKELHSSVQHIIIGKKTGFSIKPFFKLTKLLNKIKPDVIHLHLDALNYMLPYLFLHKHAKCFMTVHNDAFEEAGSKIGLRIRSFCFKSDLIYPIAISKESHRSFVECYKMDAPIVFNGRKLPDHIEISSSVKDDFASFRKTDKTKVMINLARFSVVKRQPLIAKCVKKLYEEGFDFTFLMIGLNRSKEILEEVKQNASPALFVLGQKHNPLEYLKMADAYCLFSTYEGLPISLIEALGTGAIPLCTPVGGIKDLVRHGHNGLLTADLSEEEVYKTMKNFLIMSDESVAVMKCNAVESFKKYSIEETAKQYLDIFSSSLN